MMSSLRDEDRLLLQAHADGELDLASAAALERRLASEPELRAQYEAILSLRRLIRSIPDEDVPLERLRAKVTSAIDRPIPERSSPARKNSWRALAAAALVGAVLSGTGTFIGLQQQANRQEIETFVVSNHIRSLLAEKPFDVASSDRHTIKPWFTTKLPESPPVVDLGASGFSLVGGRVDVVAGEPVASIVYRRGPHAISLTALRGVRDIPRNDISGYNVESWRDNNFTYVAVSDLPRETLNNFKRAFIAGAKPVN
jgi:anti-sigma factor RsiW